MRRYERAANNANGRSCICADSSPTRERKSIEPMVLRERGKDINAVRAVQQFRGFGAWDDDRILERHQQLVAEDLGESEATVILR